MAELLGPVRCLGGEAPSEDLAFAGGAGGSSHGAHPACPGELTLAEVLRGDLLPSCERARRDVPFWHPLGRPERDAHPRRRSARARRRSAGVAVGSLDEASGGRAAGPAPHRLERDPMLWTIAVILLVLWALGLVTSTTMGGFIHVLLVIAVVVVLIRVIQGRRVL